MKLYLKHATAAMAVGIAVVLAGTHSAVAAEPESPAAAPDSTSVVIDRAVQDIALVKPAVRDAEGVAGAGSVTELRTDRPSADIEYAGRSITVALAAGEGDKVAGTEHSSTFEDVAPATDAEVRTVPGGAQFFSVMQDASAGSQQRYVLGLASGTRLAPAGDGGYVLVDGADEAIGRIDAPWAVDAAGKSLATSFALDGNVLVQSTDLTGAAFPVVADPKVSFGIGIYVRYQRSEVKDFKDKGKFVGATALMGAACGKIPVGWLAVACGASLAVVSSSVLGTFDNASKKDRCVELKFNYQGIITEWKTKAKGSWCK
ncbi:hypothetical protein [Actinoplanes sp. NPDC049681]|uniref:hypothetical protein n=1 Tax=Actinoplanes sp. NPDC049681 TaxID=3363905 RepID=UPI0037B76B49